MTAAALKRMAGRARVRDYRASLPRYFPLPHPSWRPAGWQALRAEAARYLQQAALAA